MNFRDEEVICFCFGYTAGDIRQAIARGENTLDKLRESLEACDRCQGCRGEIQILLSEKIPPTPQSLRD
jgi:NAD(P)H-nitrite reductase large subunit